MFRNLTRIWMIWRLRKTWYFKHKNVENMIGWLDEIHRKSMNLQKSENVTKMKKFIAFIESQKIMKNLTQYAFPTFYWCKINKNYVETYLGYIEKMQGSDLSAQPRKPIHAFLCEYKWAAYSIHCYRYGVPYLSVHHGRYWWQGFDGRTEVIWSPGKQPANIIKHTI